MATNRNGVLKDLAERARDLAVEWPDAAAGFEAAAAAFHAGNVCLAGWHLRGVVDAEGDLPVAVSSLMAAADLVVGMLLEMADGDADPPESQAS